jgi:superfamily I DNA and RNA helicase
MRNDKSIVFACTKKLNMSDFNITPPRALFGAIKIGDKITLQFELPLQKQ